MNREELDQKIRDNIRAIYVFACLALALVFSFIALWTVEDAGTAYLLNLPNDEAVDLLLDLQSSGAKETNLSLLVESSISPPINKGVLAGGAFSGLFGIGNQVFAAGNVIEGDERLGVIASREQDGSWKTDPIPGMRSISEVYEFSNQLFARGIDNNGNVAVASRQPDGSWQLFAIPGMRSISEVYEFSNQLFARGRDSNRTLAVVSRQPDGSWQLLAIPGMSAIFEVYEFNNQRYAAGSSINGPVLAALLQDGTWQRYFAKAVNWQGIGVEANARLRLPVVGVIVALLLTLFFFGYIMLPNKEAKDKAAQSQKLVQQAEGVETDLITKTLEHAEGVMDSMLKRSSFLLVSGIVMALLGLFVFFTTLPPDDFIVAKD